MSERLKVPALPLFAIATAFGVSSTLQAYSMSVLEHNALSPRALPQLLALNLVYWYLPALLAPTIMAVALRYQLGRVRWSTQALRPRCRRARGTRSSTPWRSWRPGRCCFPRAGSARWRRCGRGRGTITSGSSTGCS